MWSFVQKKAFLGCFSNFGGKTTGGVTVSIVEIAVCILRVVLQEEKKVAASARINSTLIILII